MSARVLQGELSDAKRAVSQLQSSAYYPVCTRLAVARAELSAATTSLELYEQRIVALLALLEKPLPVSVAPSAPSDPLAVFMTHLSSVQQNYGQRLHALLSECATELSTIRADNLFVTLGETVRDQEVNVEHGAVALRAQELNPDVLDELMTRCESLKNELKNYDGLDGMIASSVARAEQLLDEMRTHRMALTENRKAFLSSLSLRDLDIKILPLCAPHEDILADYQAVTGISSFAERIYDHDNKSGLLHRC
ncbi:hypothetical protein RCN63_11555 [Escherichia coli]|nr:hypothetical protein [Escherichia coli]MED9858334.1 hypothetical protein [Escherichia coli]